LEIIFYHILFKVARLGKGSLTQREGAKEAASFEIKLKKASRLGSFSKGVAATPPIAGVTSITVARGAF